MKDKTIQGLCECDLKGNQEWCQCKQIEHDRQMEATYPKTEAEQNLPLADRNPRRVLGVKKMWKANRHRRTL